MPIQLHLRMSQSGTLESEPDQTHTNMTRTAATVWTKDFLYRRIVLFPCVHDHTPARVPSGRPPCHTGMAQPARRVLAEQFRITDDLSAYDKG
jgi:hypothetical protein